MDFPTWRLAWQSTKMCIIDWKRFLLACVLSPIPLINLLLLGYLLECFRVYLENPSHDYLPSWRSPWHLFLGGARVLISFLLWGLVLFGPVLFLFFVVGDVAMFFIGGLSIIAVTILFYLFPSIFINEARKPWGSIHPRTLHHILFKQYFYQFLVILTLNILAGFLGQLMPFTLALTSTWLLIISAKGFSVALGAKKPSS